MRLSPVAALAAGSLAAAPVAAQESPCRPEDTVTQCIARLQQGVARAAAGDGAAGVKQRTESRSTGLGVGRAGTSIADFLPILSTMLSGSTGEAAEALALDLNIRLDFDPARHGMQTFRLRVTRNAPEPFAPLLAALPDSVRVEREAALRDGLNEFDDLEVGVAWNLESGAFGRAFGQHRDLWGSIFSRTTAAAERGAAEAGIATDPTAVSRLLNELEDTDFAAGCSPDDAGDPAVLRLRCLEPGPRGRLVREIRTTLAGESRLDSVVQAALVTRGFFRFGDLVNNQPQLNLEAHARIRDDVAGPSSFGATLRFEMGFANVNQFRAYCRRTARTAPDLCLMDYLALPGVVEALQRGDRVWLAVDYERTEDYGFTLLPESVAVSVAGPQALTVSGGAGRYLGRTAENLEAGRLDLQAEYVFRVSDAVRENRFQAAVTYTQRLSDGASFVLGLNYANRPDFLGAVDRKLTANFGVRYSLHRPDEEP